MEPNNVLARNEAQKNWERARSSATLEQITSFLSGTSADLIPFDEVQQRLHLRQKNYRGIHQVELSKIRGSVGRYRDFTKSFMPKSDTLRARWQRVNAAAFAKGMDPIDLYKVGDAYFVVDGNHRCSIARQADMEFIEAHVWEFTTPVGLSADADFEEVLLKAEQAEFLERTNIDDLLPEHNIEFTELGSYHEFERQVEWYRHVLAQIDEEEVSFTDALLAYYDMIYTPALMLIREQDLMRRFEDRTESDLFIWIWKNHRYLQAYNRAGSLADTAGLMDKPSWQRRMIHVYDKVFELFNTPSGDW